MLRKLKFRAWMDEARYMVYFTLHKKPNNVFESDPVMEWTGLTDREGNDIFEGDKVRSPNNTIWVVEWNKDHACFQLNSNGTLAEPIDNNNIKVIGNIYQPNTPFNG